MKRYLLFCCLAISLQGYGATPQVPSRIWFADIKLHLSKDERKRVQEKVDSLTRSEKYFQTLLDRANLFLPIIERVFKEENFPLDFRYLVLQESELVSDVVSRSNAVGFWQFKEPAAREVGLKIDRHIDERMHITAATRAATKYVKQHNKAFNNWLYALLAYNEGVGGARKFIQKHYLGAKTMKIGRNAHVYIIHVLAYKIAFEQVLGRDRHPVLFLYEYQETHGKTLGEISKELGVDIQQVTAYNKWLKRYRVPQGTTCTAIIPMTHQQYARRGTSKKKRHVSKEEYRLCQVLGKSKKFSCDYASKKKKI